jgi:hypothetical protein
MREADSPRFADWVIMYYTAQKQRPIRKRAFRNVKNVVRMFELLKLKLCTIIF